MASWAALPTLWRRRATASVTEGCRREVAHLRKKHLRSSYAITNCKPRDPEAKAALFCVNTQLYTVRLQDLPPALSKR